MQPLDRLTFTVARAYMCQTQTELRFGLSATSFGLSATHARPEHLLTYLAPTPVKVPYREFEGVIMYEGAGRGMWTQNNEPKSRSHRRGTHKS